MFQVFGVKTVAKFNETPNTVQRYGSIGAHKPIVSDFHETGWENVLQKAPNELHGIHVHGPVPVTAGFPVADGHGSSFHFHNTVIGDGDLEHIRCQVLDGLPGCSDGLYVDVPIQVPYVRGNPVHQPGRFHEVTELCAIDTGKRPDREIEVFR